MLPDALVNPLVMPAKDNDIAFQGKFVGDSLRKNLAVRRHENNFVVVPFCLQVIDAVEYGFHHHYHAGVSAIGIIVYGLAAAQPIFAKVVDINLGQAFFDGPGGDGMAQRAFEQFRNHADNVNSKHTL